MHQYIEFISNHYLLFLAAAIVSFLLIQDIFETAFSKFTTLSPLLAVTKMNSSDAVVVDVRDNYEFNKSHITGAINIPVAKIDDQLDSLTQYQQRPVIVVCQTGNRAATACRALIKADFAHIFSISGGMRSWEEHKLPIQSVTQGKK